MIVILFHQMSPDGALTLFGIFGRCIYSVTNALTLGIYLYINYSFLIEIPGPIVKLI